MVSLSKTPEVGKTFTTAKSNVTGEVKEIVKNANGSLRVRLDVAGQDRWTTVKQFTAPDLSMSRLNYSSFKIVSVIKRLTVYIPLVEALDVWGLVQVTTVSDRQGSQPLTKTEYFDKIILSKQQKGDHQVAKSKSKKAPVFNYLEKWETRYGTSERVVTRQNGRFVTNVSLTGLRKAPRIK